MDINRILKEMGKTLIGKVVFYAKIDYSDLVDSINGNNQGKKYCESDIVEVKQTGNFSFLVTFSDGKKIIADDGKNNSYYGGFFNDWFLIGGEKWRTYKTKKSATTYMNNQIEKERARETIDEKIPL